VSNTCRIQIVRQTSVTSIFNVITLANCLRDAGHTVAVVCVEPVTESVAGLTEGIAVTGLGAGKASGWRKVRCRLDGARRLRRYLHGRTFDVLYVIDSWTLPTLWLATLGSLRWPGAKLVYHTFDWLEPGLVAEAHRRLERKVCHRADLVVNTDRARARMQQTLYQLKTTPLWVQNCLSKTIAIPPPNASVRQELAGAADTSPPRIIIYPTVVSNAESAQRMTWELIQGFRRLPESYRLVLFYREGVEYRRCRTACVEAGVSNRVRFLEPVPFLRLLDYVASADAGAIFYDDSESSGYFMCNADKLSLLAACGIPFVASDQPNLESVTYRHGLGKCCNPRDSIALADAFRAVVDGATPLAQWKQQARKAFLEHLNFEVHGRRLLAALDNLGKAASRNSM
jgi:glycosyltransferase involved in cell wall biosynthesis